MSKKKGGTVRFDKEERESLIPSSPSNKKPGRVWGAPLEESDDTRNLTNDQMMTFQQRKMDEQDSVLDILSKSVGTIKEIAIGIGDETDQHLELIDDIDSRVDKTSVRIRNTTRQVERTERKASTGCMWFCILFLLLGLIAISVAGQSWKEYFRGCFKKNIRS